MKTINKAKRQKTIITTAASILLTLNASAQFSGMQKIVASDRAADDYFGTSVSISDSYAIVGAYWEDQDAAGGNSLTGAGSAYIYERIAGAWTQAQKIVASDRAANDYFGNAVSISGSYAIVGANAEDHNVAGGDSMVDAGAVYIFERIAGVWTQVQKIVASDRTALDYFGRVVSISGSYAIVGAYNEDHDATGGNTFNDAGSAYIFERIAGVWTQVQKIVASDRAPLDYFGRSVSIFGSYAIVGANAEDHDVAGGDYKDGAGSAYIFERIAGVWTQVQKIVASDREAMDLFGWSVGISGYYAIVGTYSEDHDATGGNYIVGAGSAYIFERIAGVWTQVQKIVASDREADDNFGKTVSISGSYAIAGAHWEDHDATGGNYMAGAGSVYIFERDGSGNWTQVQKIVASDRASNDYFAYSISISGACVIVGAQLEDHDVAGGSFMNAAGSAYILSNPALPIELLTFDATPVKDNNNEYFVRCNWSTATEINNDYFTVERSKDGKVFANIGTRQGAGNSSTTLYYEFDDWAPYTGLSYYQLKQTDYDGNYSYSRIVAVYIGEMDIINISPSPAEKEIEYTIKISETTPAQVKVINVLGQTVINETETIEKGVTQKKLDISMLASGFYMLSINTERLGTTEKKFAVK